MKWIKATEKLPNKGQVVAIRIIEGSGTTHYYRYTAGEVWKSPKGQLSVDAGKDGLVPIGGNLTEWILLEDSNESSNKS